MVVPAQIENMKVYFQVLRDLMAYMLRNPYEAGIGKNATALNSKSRSASLRTGVMPISAMLSKD